jgi:hypothetical protein
MLHGVCKCFVRDKNLRADKGLEDYSPVRTNEPLKDESWAGGACLASMRPQVQTPVPPKKQKGESPSLGLSLRSTILWCGFLNSAITCQPYNFYHRQTIIYYMVFFKEIHF